MKVTQELVDELNRYQKAGAFHPYTCGLNRKDKYHLDRQGILVATLEGWKCPYCTYTQDFREFDEEFMNSMK